MSFSIALSLALFRFVLLPWFSMMLSMEPPLIMLLVFASPHNSLLVSFSIYALLSLEISTSSSSCSSTSWIWNTSRLWSRLSLKNISVVAAYCMSERADPAWHGSSSTIAITRVVFFHLDIISFLGSILLLLLEKLRGLTLVEFPLGKLGLQSSWGVVALDRHLM